MTTILILCRANSSRSQMAQGFLSQLAGDRLRVLSAGTSPLGYIHPLAIKVMAEIGIDISGQGCHHVSEYLNEPVDVVATVCEEALENCPVFPPHVRRYHWRYTDPAAFEGSEEDALDLFRKVRDQIQVVTEAYLFAGRQGGELGRLSE